MIYCWVLSLLSSLGLHLVSHCFVQHSPSHASSLISPISPFSFAFRLFFFSPSFFHALDNDPTRRDAIDFSASLLLPPLPSLQLPLVLRKIFFFFLFLFLLTAAHLASPPSQGVHLLFVSRNTKPPRDSPFRTFPYRVVKKVEVRKEQKIIWDSVRTRSERSVSRRKRA